MKYLKLFPQESDYQVFITGGGVELPNVSYCENENEVHYNPLIQLNNEIWYTSSNGKIVEPSSDSTAPFLDANGNNIPIVSNTYENGKGVIKLEKDCYKLGNYAFNGRYSLTGITIPDSVTSIGNNAFTLCYSLTGITIPNSITSIGNSAFSYCSKLTSIIVQPETPPTLGSSAFDEIAVNVVIYVPSGSVDAYKTATNWSTYADKIQAIPD